MRSEHRRSHRAAETGGDAQGAADGGRRCGRGEAGDRRRRRWQRGQLIGLMHPHVEHGGDQARRAERVAERALVSVDGRIGARTARRAASSTGSFSVAVA